MLRKSKERNTREISQELELSQNPYKRMTLPSTENLEELGLWFSYMLLNFLIFIQCET